MINKVTKLKLQYFNMVMHKLHVKETKRCRRHAMIPKYILIPNLGFLLQIIYRYALGSTLLELNLGQGHSDLEPDGNSPGPKMYLHTQYGTATINNIGDLL